MSWYYFEKYIFSRKVEFSGLVGNETLVGRKKFGGGSIGRLSRWERWVSFGQWGRDSLHPPSRENPVVPSNSVENLKPHLAKPPPRGRWKFKVPQGLIKLPPPFINVWKYILKYIKIYLIMMSRKMTCMHWCSYFSSSSFGCMFLKDLKNSLPSLMA